MCSSPYRQPDDCPNQDANRKPRRSALVCFDFNNASGCNRRSCYFPHNCRHCGSASHALFSCPSSRQSTSAKSASSSIFGSHNITSTFTSLLAYAVPPIFLIRFRRHWNGSLNITTAYAMLFIFWMIFSLLNMINLIAWGVSVPF